jgi:hypothetical protein
LSIVLLFSVYELLHGFYIRASEEVVNSWFQNEVVNLQQGNILSTITKLQRAMTESSLMRGAVAIDQSGRELARIGEVETVEQPLESLGPEMFNQETLMKKHSFGFSSQFEISISSVRILVFVESLFLEKIMFGVLVYFLTFFLFSGFMFRKLLVEHEKLKAEIATKSLKEKLLITEAVAEVAKQVAHDIRSPLMALDVALRDTSGLSSEKRNLIEQASARIKNIADDLLSKSRENRVASLQMPEKELVGVVSELMPFNLAASSRKILLEKKTLYPNVNFVLDGLNEQIHAHGFEKDFERMLSNLLQNSIEAGEEMHTLQVSISLRVYADQVQLTIMDNGKGIPGEILSKIGEEGFTHGKSNGNGLGVSFAKKKIADWDGTLNINSKVGLGTIVSICLPLCNISGSVDFPHEVRA